MSGEVCAPASPLEIHAGNAVKVSRWIEHCGGVAVWASGDLGQPGRSWLTPVCLTDGSLAQRPHWSADPQPQRVITEPGQVEVVERREVKRLRVAVRPGYGLGFRLTDASSARLREALEAAGPGALHAFEGSEAVILGEVGRTPLPQWLAEHPDAKAV
jgi:hypothetical protein